MGIQLVCRDRVGINPVWIRNLWLNDTITPKTHGDLVLTRDGLIAFVSVYKSDTPWTCQVDDLHDVSFSVQKGKGFVATIQGKQRVIVFTGIPRFLSKNDTLLGHVPHGAGGLYEITKILATNPHMSKNADAAAKVWRDVLEKKIKPDQLPVLEG